MSWMRVAWLPLAGFVFACTAGSVLAYEDTTEPLPCNSLCQRWMGISSDPSEAPARAAPDESASAPQATPSVAARPGPPLPLTSATVAEPKLQPERKPQVASQKASVRKHLAVLPPSRAIVLARTEAPAGRPALPTVQPAAPVVALVHPHQPLPQATPFGTVASVDPVQRMVEMQPPPPPAPHVDVIALAASPARTAPQIITMMGPAVADPAPPVVLAKAEPAIVAEPPEPATVPQPSKAMASEQPKPSLQAAPVPHANKGWPPPIDVIGAILMQAPASRSINTTADASR